MYLIGFPIKRHQVSKKVLWLAISISFSCGYLLHSILSNGSSHLTRFVSIKNTFYDYSIQIVPNLTQIFDLKLKCDNVDDNLKFDCNPDLPINEDVCVKRGCCWKPQLQVKTKSKW